MEWEPIKKKNTWVIKTNKKETYTEKYTYDNKYKNNIYTHKKDIVW